MTLPQFFKLLRFVKTWKRHDQVAHCLKCSRRSAFRHMKMIEKMGFQVERRFVKDDNRVGPAHGEWRVLNPQRALTRLVKR